MLSEFDFAFTKNGLSWAPRCVILEYDLEQRSGELLQAYEVFCRGTRTAPMAVEANKDHVKRTCISEC